MRRQTISDLFVAAEQIGLPERLTAKITTALDRAADSMKNLAARLEKATRKLGENDRALIQSLPARLLGRMSEGLAGLDAITAGTVTDEVLDTIASIAESKQPITAERVRALEILAFAVAQLPGRNIGPELRSAALLTDGIDPQSAHAAATTISEQIGTLLDATDFDSVGGLFRVAFASAVAACENDKEPAKIATESAKREDVALNAGQLKIATSIATAARSAKKKTTAEDKKAQANLNAQRKQFDDKAKADAKLDPLKPLMERAQEQLSPVAEALFISQVVGNANQDDALLRAIAEVQLEHLVHAEDNPPTANLVNQISAKLQNLAGLGNISANALTQFAQHHVRNHPATELAPTISLATNILRDLEAKKVKISDEALTSLADGLAGRTKVLANQAQGGQNLLINTIAAASKAAQADVIRDAPRFVESMIATEPGPARDVISAHFAEDLAQACAQTPLSTIASQYPLLPEEGLPRFVAIGRAMKQQPDVWLNQLTELFKAARGNKQHTRSIRNLIVLTAEAGTDTPKLVTALLGGDMRPQQLTRTVNALLNANNMEFTKAQVDKAITRLNKGENVARDIEEKLQKEMAKKLGLDELLKAQNVASTAAGRAEISDKLSQFFSTGANSPNVDQKMFKQLLVAVLEERFDTFRFTLGPSKKQLKMLNADQLRAWEKTATLTHVRFEDDGEKEFNARITSASKIAKTLLGRMEQAWGKLDGLRKKHVKAVTKLREINKNNRAERQKLVKEIRGVPAMIAALEWATNLAEMTPKTTTPERFAETSEFLPSLGRMLGPQMEPAINELMWTIRIDDLPYSEVITNDAPSLSTIKDLASMHCLAGWPGRVDLLAYAIDGNKRVVITKNQAGTQRRATMRLVTRQDEGHKGEPMLILERCYPDEMSADEKKRIVEHALRRATEMGITAAYPTEYYVDIQNTSRFRHRKAPDMDEVLKDLNARYNTTSEIKVLKVTSPGGNVKQEYIDSAPTGGAADAGNVQIRRYDGTKDTTYENRFLVLEPKE